MIVAFQQNLLCIWTLSPFFHLYSHGFSYLFSLCTYCNHFKLSDCVSIIGLLAQLLWFTLLCHLQKPAVTGFWSLLNYSNVIWSFHLWFLLVLLCVIMWSTLWPRYMKSTIQIKFTYLLKNSPQRRNFWFII